MKGPLSADRLFFISALVFTASFVLYSVSGYIWPIPVIPDELLAQLPPDPFMDPTSPAAVVSQLMWFLSVAGVITFVLGLVARKS